MGAASDILCLDYQKSRTYSTCTSLVIFEIYAGDDLLISHIFIHNADLASPSFIVHVVFHRSRPRTCGMTLDSIATIAGMSVVMCLGGGKYLVGLGP